MRWSVKVGEPEAVKADAAVLAVGELDGRVPGRLRGLDRVLDGAVARAVKTGDFTGRRDQTLMLYPSSGPLRVVLVGMGPVAGITAAAIRRAAAVGARKAVEAGAGSMTFGVPPQFRRKCPPRDFGQVAAEGIGQGAWRFDELRTDDEPRGELRQGILLAGEDERGDVERGRKVGAAIAEGHALARELQALPANHCPPRHLASVARTLGRRFDLKVRVLSRAQMADEGMNALLAVAQGTAEEPRLIVLEYRGAGSAAPICLVGKGVTFDSGGISLKPALNMEEMKYDMSGAAAVLGTFHALGRIKPKVNVVGIIPATENLPSGTAVKPGDVVRTHFGKTVEIINTDAEGRLILCDALSYARRYKPSCILDIATLTGAILIALGSAATGAMGNDEALLEAVRQAGERADERCWPLPLWDEYRALIKSETADIKNSAGRPAGSITAGWFLREFVESDMPWVHLDIAGTAWGDGNAAVAKGPTGVGVRLFSHFVLDRVVG